MHEFHLPDMSCGHCVATITEVLQALDPLVRLEFDRDARRVRVQSELGRAALAAALRDAGYPEA